MTLNEKHRQVREWLSSVFVDGHQPQYEISERPLEILHLLKSRCEEREERAKYVIEDLRQKTAEYKAEASRLGAILHQLGLMSSCLSQSGVVSLRTLTSVALLLDIRNSTETSYLLGMRELSKDLTDVLEARRSEQKVYSQLLAKTKLAVNKTNSLQRALQSLNDQTNQQSSEMEKKAKQAGFLQSKAREYRQHVHQYQTQLERSGLHSNLRHEQLCKSYEDLQELEEKLIPLKAKLSSYQDLPPDLSLAKLKIEETRHQLLAMEKELSKHIDMMHM